MSGEHEFERELKAALSVSPSPGFEARVLQRVGEEPVRLRLPSARANWRTAGLLALAATLLIAVALIRGLGPPGAPPPPPQAPVAHRMPGLVPDAQPALAERVRPHVRRRAAANPRPASSPAPVAEVLVPVNQMEAVRRLVRAVNEGRVPPVQEARDTYLGPSPDLVVVPLVVEPIPVPAVESVGGQQPLRPPQ